MERKIERFDRYMKFKGLNDNRVTIDLGLSVGTLGKSRKEGRDLSTKNIELILNFYKDLNRVWLLTGEGEMLVESPPVSAAPLREGRHGASKVPLADVGNDYTTWLLPQSAIGGSLSGFATDGVLLQNCEKVISPIKGVDFAISVYGESMAPEYPSGSRVLIKKINPDIFIDWGKVYVLDTSNGVIIKEVIVSPKEGCIRCHSINPDPKYADFDVPMDEVYGMYRVLMCLSAK